MRQLGKSCDGKLSRVGGDYGAGLSRGIDRSLAADGCCDTVAVAVQISRVVVPCCPLRLPAQPAQVLQVHPGRTALVLGLALSLSLLITAITLTPISLRSTP